MNMWVAATLEIKVPVHKRFETLVPVFQKGVYTAQDINVGPLGARHRKVLQRPIVCTIR
eukprot:m.258465 g.258465  ORF g.258465 m.258465 type:complete len:59 (+) comp36600_c0_seq1:351-527(+)